MEGEKFILESLEYFSKNLPKFLWSNKQDKCENLRLNEFAKMAISSSDNFLAPFMEFS